MAYRAVLLAVFVGLIGCGGDDDDAGDPPDAALPDGDEDGVPDVSDNCPGLANADQSDQDDDGFGDLCDCANDNDSVAVVNTDFDDNKRNANNRGCAADEILTGVVTGLGASGYIDTIARQCTKRCNPGDTSESFGEDPVSRGDEFACPAGSVIVGVVYKDADGAAPPNDAVDAIGILCAPADGPDSNAVVVDTPDLDANPGPLITLQCPEGATAAGLVDIDSPTTSGNSDALEGISILCRAGRW